MEINTKRDSHIASDSVGVNYFPYIFFDCFEGYSWCVDKNGNFIEGTIVQPNCSCKKDCPQADCSRENFNENNREPKKLLDGIVFRYKRFMNENVKKAATRKTVTNRLERISKNRKEKFDRFNEKCEFYAPEQSPHTER